MSKIIDGKEFAQKIRNEVKDDASSLKEKSNVEACLAVVLVGENPASKVYVGAKTKMAAECGIKTKDFKFILLVENNFNKFNNSGVFYRFPVLGNSYQKNLYTSLGALKF